MCLTCDSYEGTVIICIVIMTRNGISPEGEGEAISVLLGTGSHFALRLVCVEEFGGKISFEESTVVVYLVRPLTVSLNGPVKVGILVICSEIIVEADPSFGIGTIGTWSYAAGEALDSDVDGPETVVEDVKVNRLAS